MWRGEQDEQNHPFPLCSLLLSRGTGRKGKFGGILKWIDNTFPPFPYKIKRWKSIYNFPYFYTTIVTFIMKHSLYFLLHL